MNRINRKAKTAILLAMGLVLSACSQVSEVRSLQDGNLWDRYIIYNLSQVIQWLANLFGGSYVLGIIVFTVFIRILLTPLYRMQLKSQREMQELQPELNAIKDRYPNKDRQSLDQMQAEQSALMEERGVNQYAGCLPLLIQMPVMIALYQAILNTQELREGNFLWMNLGEPDPYFILPIIAALLTFATTYFTMKSNPTKNAATTGMMFFSPALILFIGLGLPSAIAIYWVVSNAVTLVMTFIYNNPYKIIEEREMKIQQEKERQRELRKQLRRATGSKKK